MRAFPWSSKSHGDIIEGRVTTLWWSSRSHDNNDDDDDNGHDNDDDEDDGDDDIPRPKQPEQETTGIKLITHIS